jgi:hypothetical protein
MAKLTIGTKVIFGTENGAKTRGTVMKINRAKAKIRQDEVRNSRPIGTVWGVPPSLIQTEDGQFVTDDWEIVDKRVDVFMQKYSDEETMPTQIWMNQHKHEIHILSGIYSSLSPENLTCDGELSRSMVNQRARELQRKMDAVFVLMGRRMSETVCWECMKVLPTLEQKTFSELLSS